MLDKKAIGKRIEQIKNSHIPPLNLVELGAKLKNKKGLSIPKGTVNSWIRGLSLPSIEIVQQLALIGDVTPEWIYTGTEIPKLKCEDCKSDLIIESNNIVLCIQCSTKFKMSKHVG
ncbi:predicted transcriptional regulator (plasmid) [Bacillus cereus Q1]|uniref:Predicted transcriptional regulator n=1 Tax=Bacillus cereus (strain Q1) TaxID=361100 RepID=B9J631_BACCQ|nr:MULTISPECIES: helix-turn-helix transcriptional regulator [Bacillus cereus group]ACM15826.1 predicted transcriptional regulator [Bacillus cereus Q1]ONG91611.1 transcriptional regulator [Bacillus cereus]MDA1663029.1 helix-turn-helix transcriptional regulator [Bacillus cereus group sp. TH153LC]MED1612644.1 helix-turn-helix transcriptional regulator [Bacillus paranthracis]MED1683994.1 helix-turn-helix transcriptional regulator [Bacillus paranthracis]